MLGEGRETRCSRCPCLPVSPPSMRVQAGGQMGASRGRGGRATTLSAPVPRIALPFPLIIVAGGWPSALVVVVQLCLPLVAAYFPAKFRSYFNGSKRVRVKWRPPHEFTAATPPDPAIYLVSGSLDFVLRSLQACKRPEWALATVEIELRGLSREKREK